jgi:hypothetical protein
MAVLPKGTSFAVNLFSIFQHVVIFKVGYGEYRHIDEFQRLLAHPNIYFTFFIMEVKCSICFKHEAANCYYLFWQTNEKLVPVQEDRDRYDSWIYR